MNPLFFGWKSSDCQILKMFLQNLSITICFDVGIELEVGGKWEVNITLG